MAKRRRKLSFRRDKPLPTDFSRDYVIALKALSRQHKSAPEALKAVKLLKRMSREAFLAGRGEVWIPNPGPTTGHYPVIENLPFSKIRTALRKNTLKRERAWTAVAAATRPFYPQHSAISQMEKSLLPAIITSIPFVRGRSPALLGKRVPGELQMTRKGGSAIPIKGMSPDEWIQHGFQPLKFVLEPIDALVYARGYQYGLRSFLQRHRVAEKLKRGALPAALGGLVLEGLRRAHTEIGIPPTTVDLVPVQRTTFKGEYAPYTNMQLRAFQNALEGKLPEAEEHTASEIKKQIGKIDIEIIGRRAV